MVMKCAVFGCTTRYDRDGLRYYRIPAICNRNAHTLKLSKKRQRLWLNKIRRTELNTVTARVCELHFLSGRSAKLGDSTNIDWLPTLKMGYGENTEDISRKIRAEQRTEKKNTNQQQQINICSDIDITNNADIISTPDYGDIGCQTDVSTGQVNQWEMCYFREKLKSKKSELTIESFQGDNDKVNYFTGIPEYEKMEYLFSLVKDYLTFSPVLTAFEIFLITLMRLRLDLAFTYMSYRFAVTQPTISKNFYKCLYILYNALKEVVVWPTRAALQKSMPLCFRECFNERVTVVIDCFEIYVQKSSLLHTAAKCWSNYKHAYTIKYLIGIAPQGAIMFISPAFGGRCSDKEITIKSGFLEKLQEGDVVMCDRGFLINGELAERGVGLEIPAFTLRKNQLHPVSVETTRNIANVRIHVERVIGTLKQKYRILSQRKFPINLLLEKHIVFDADVTILDQIVQVCCSLINLGPPIVARETHKKE